MGRLVAVTTPTARSSLVGLTLLPTGATHRSHRRRPHPQGPHPRRPRLQGPRPTWRASPARRSGQWRCWSSPRYSVCYVALLVLALLLEPWSKLFPEAMAGEYLRRMEWATVAATLSFGAPPAGRLPPPLPPANSASIWPEAGRRRSSGRLLRIPGCIGGRLRGLPPRGRPARPRRVSTSRPPPPCQRHRRAGLRLHAATVRTTKERRHAYRGPPSPPPPRPQAAPSPGPAKPTRSSLLTTRRWRPPDPARAPPRVHTVKERVVYWAVVFFAVCAAYQHSWEDAIKCHPTPCSLPWCRLVSRAAPLIALGAVQALVAGCHEPAPFPGHTGLHAPQDRRGRCGRPRRRAGGRHLGGVRHLCGQCVARRRDYHGGVAGSAARRGACQVCCGACGQFASRKS